MAENNNNKRRARIRTFTGQKQTKSTVNIRGEVGVLPTKVAPRKNPNGQTAEVSLTAVISTLRVRIPRRRHTTKLKRKRHKRMSSIDSITKSTTSSKVSNTKVAVMRRTTRGMTKTATSTNLSKQGSARNRSLRFTPSMNRKKIPCFTSSIVVITSGT